MTFKDKKLLITRRFPEDVLARAQRDYKCTYNNKDVTWSDDEMLTNAKGQDGILCSSSNNFTSDIVDDLPKSVRIVATYSVGFEHLDVESLKARNVAATNTPDVLSAATADIAFMLILCASRRAREADQMVRDGLDTNTTTGSGAAR